MRPLTRPRLIAPSVSPLLSNSENRWKVELEPLSFSSSSPRPCLFEFLSRFSPLQVERIRSSFRLTFDPENNIFNFVKRSFTCAPVPIQYDIALHA